MDINIFMFDGFETLDIFGPIEILGRVEEFSLKYFSQYGGVITNAQGVKLITEPVANADVNGILVIPGGRGTRTLANDITFLKLLKDLAVKARFCLSICTGSALLGKCGVLDSRAATSNKAAMAWVKSIATSVQWIDKARWVVDGKYYTSSGVSAGMDMTLGFVSDQFGRNRAEEIATHIEYIWNDDRTDDRFAR